MSDDIVLNSNAHYWTGKGWSIKPEHAQDVSLQKAIDLALIFPTIAILGFSQLVEINPLSQRLGFQISYPDGSSKEVSNNFDFAQELCSWFSCFA